MLKIFTGGQYQELLLKTQERQRLSGADFVERAGSGLLYEFMRHYHAARHDVYVFAGAEDHGAYGLCLARLLAERNYRVYVYLIYRSGTISPVCQEQRNRLSGTGVALEDVYAQFDVPMLAPSDVVVDALVGSELLRPLEGGYRELVCWLNSVRCHKVSIDLPSGLFSQPSNQMDLDHIFRADRTLVLGTPRLPCLLSEYAPYVGQWSLIEIALDERAYEEGEAEMYLSTDQAMARTIRVRPSFSSQEHFGRVLMCGGSDGCIGRVALASEAALRVGSGDATMLLPSGTLGAWPLLREARVVDSYSCISEELHLYRGMALCSSLGPEVLSDEALELLLRNARYPIVIDAGMYRRRQVGYRQLLELTPEHSVVCFSSEDLRELVAHFNSDLERIDYVRALALRLGIYVVLKGTYTAVCLKGGNVIFNSTGNPGMATAGSDEVLLGSIAGLLAQGYPSSTASVLGVYLHGLAGDIYVGKYAEAPLIGGDLSSFLPHAFRQLLAQG